MDLDWNWVDIDNRSLPPRSGSPGSCPCPCPCPRELMIHQYQYQCTKNTNPSQYHPTPHMHTPSNNPSSTHMYQLWNAKCRLEPLLKNIWRNCMPGSSQRKKKKKSSLVSLQKKSHHSTSQLSLKSDSGFWNRSEEKSENEN